MATPRFSVLIPTRDRPATFRHTLATVASQPGDDYEIIVADNCSGPETSQIVKELAFPRLRYAYSDEVLPMAANWERGLSLCSGEFVTVLGDDDGFVKDLYDVPRGHPEWKWDNPIAAVAEFAAAHPELVLEPPGWLFNESALQHNITYWPQAWLRRKA